MNALELFAAERQRQIEQKGYTPEHDDHHTKGELTYAALSYALVAARQQHIFSGNALARGGYWPFDGEDFKPSASSIHNLVRAGALIVAEIERLERMRRTQT